MGQLFSAVFYAVSSRYCISFYNYSSIILSHSSYTIRCILSSLKLSVLLRWKDSLPGVPTIILRPLRNLSFSDFTSYPPINKPETILTQHCVILIKLLYICYESSLVGQTIKIRHPILRVTFYSPHIRSLIIGRR